MNLAFKAKDRKILNFHRSQMENKLTVRKKRGKMLS